MSGLVTLHFLPKFSYCLPFCMEDISPPKCFLFFHRFMENDLSHGPCVQSGRFLQEHQGIACKEAMRKDWESAFQKDCTLERAVPWQCVQHKSGSSCLSLHQNMHFCIISRSHLSESRPTGDFHTVLTSSLVTFAKKKFHTLMVSQGDSRQDWETAQYADQAGDIRGRKVKEEDGNDCNP